MAGSVEPGDWTIAVDTVIHDGDRVIAGPINVEDVKIIVCVRFVPHDKRELLSVGTDNNSVAVEQSIFSWVVVGLVETLFLIVVALLHLGASSSVRCGVAEDSEAVVYVEALVIF